MNAFEQHRLAFSNPEYNAQRLLDYNSWMKGVPPQKKPIPVTKDTANKLSVVTTKILKQQEVLKKFTKDNSSLATPSQDPTGSGGDSRGGDRGDEGSGGVDDKGPGGSPGSDGGAGSSGSSGPAGSTGDAGAQGSSRLSGTSGSSGTNGSSGAAGSQGASQLSGTSGSSGTGGSTGNQGNNGSSRLSGTSGSSGSGGSSGIAGSQGASQLSGTSGSSGTGGSPGGAGSSRSSGPAGSPVTSGAPPANTTRSVVQSASQNTGMQSILANPGEAAKEASGFAGDVVGNIGAGLEIQKTAIKTLVEEEIKHLSIIQKTDRIEDVANRWDGTGMVFGGIGILGGMIEFLKSAYDIKGALAQYKEGDARDKHIAKEMGYSGVQGVITGALGTAQAGLSSAEIVNTTADIGDKAATTREAATNAEALQVTAQEAVDNFMGIAPDASVSLTDKVDAGVEMIGAIGDSMEGQAAANVSYDTLRTAVMESSDASASSVVGIVLGGVKAAIGGMNLIYDRAHMKKMQKFKPKTEDGTWWKNLIINKIWKRIKWDAAKTLTGGAALAAGILALGNPVSVTAAVVIGATGSAVSLGTMFYKYYKKRKHKQKKTNATNMAKEAAKAAAAPAGAPDPPEDVKKAQDLVNKLKSEVPNIKDENLKETIAGIKDDVGKASVMVASAVREGDKPSLVETGKKIKDIEDPPGTDDKGSFDKYNDGKETVNALGVSEEAAILGADVIKKRISVTSRM